MNARRAALTAVLLLVPMAALSIAQGATRGGTTDLVDRQSRPLTPGAAGGIDLETTGGDITVTSGPGAPTLEVVRHVRARSDSDAAQALTQAGFVVDNRTGRVRAVDIGSGRSAARMDVSFVARVPASTDLHLHSTGGDITVTGVKGDINAQATGGTIALTDVGNVGMAHTVGGSITIVDTQARGDLRIHSVSGTITLTRTKASELTVDTVSGDILATDVSAREVSVTNIMGDVAYRGPLVRDGHYDIHTHSGSIRFDPTGPVGFELEARTFSGTITVAPSLRLQTTSLGRRSVVGTSGRGDAAVVVGTFNGDVTIGPSGRQ